MTTTEAEFKSAQQLLIDGHPGDAVRAARRSYRRAPSEGAKRMLAAILIDASPHLRQPSLAREGRDLLLSLEARWPPHALTHLHYNVGNAFAALGHFEKGLGAG